MLKVFSNQRRRFALHFLKREQIEAGTDLDGVSVDELIDHVASWENDKSIERVTPQERKRVKNALEQFHLPKLVEEGFVNYDPVRGCVRLTEEAATNDFYVDILSNRGITWGAYYVYLVAVSAACLLGIVLEIPPFSRLTPLLFSVFFVTAFGVSALGHYYDNRYRMRFGSQEMPLELEA